MGTVDNLRRRLLVALGATAMLLFLAASVSAAKVEPVLLEGASNDGKSCADNEGGGQNWTQLKIDPNVDGTFTDGTLSVTITHTQEDKVFNWTSNLGVDAVVVKGGSDGSYLYRYDPPSEETSDSGLTSPGQNAISHINFCYDQEQPPPPKPGSLTVVKHVVNDDGGTNESDEWTMNVSGPTDVQFAGAESPGTKTTVDPGDYTVTESGPSGYLLSYSGDCDSQGNVTVGEGEEKTCTLTNDDQPAPPQPGQIVIEKQAIPDNELTTFGFSGEIVANLSDGQTASKSVAAGTYSVTEDEKFFWDVFSIVCDDDDSSGSLETRTATFNVAAGETVKCVFTNVKRGDIHVIKQTDPDGATQVFDFDASYDADGFSLSDGGDNWSGALKPGIYSVSEHTTPGWELTRAVCSDGSSVDAIELEPTEDIICTFTNTKEQPQPGSIIVKKETDPDGDSQSFEFDPSYGDGFSLSDGQQNDSGNLVPGTYSVSENELEGWDLTSIVCSDGSEPGSIDLEAGELVTCVFTNTKRGSIVVEKQTSPNGAPDSFSFSGDASGSISDGGQITVSNLEPGTYTSTEGAASGWNLSSISCDDKNSSGDLGDRTATFELEAGETVKCTFSNTKLVAGQGALSVSKSADPTTLQEPGGPVTYSVRITNPSSVNITVTNVVDDKFGDLDDDGGSGCFDVPVNLAPGAFSSCQFVKQITGAGGTSHVNTVTASGHDEFGNPLSASDDARVDITQRLIDLVIVKDATSPTPLNGTVTYTMTVTNKGLDTATNVQLADPAPAGISYLSATPLQGSCSVTPVLVTCTLGDVAVGQTVTITVTAKATQVGTHTNTATVTGSGGRETNPADNVDDAVTVVPAPLKPPTVTPKPKPKPKAKVCLTVTVSPKLVKADGKPDKVVVKVTAAGKRVKGAKVLVKGAGVRRTGRTNGQGIAVVRINAPRPGLITVSTLEREHVCGAKRIGVVGVFLPPLTG